MKRAFTLVELLVVICVIAVLLTIAGSSLIGVRASQRKIQCSVNLRSLKDAAMQYAAHNARGLLPACNSPMVIRGTCTEDRIRAPILAVSDYLDSPVPTRVGYSQPLPWWNDGDSFPPPMASTSLPSPFACPSDNLYAPRIGISYDFAPSQQMLDMVRQTATAALVLEESSHQWGSGRFGAPGPLWEDLNMDAHRAAAPPGVLGCVGSYANGKIDWVGYRRFYGSSFDPR